MKKLLYTLCSILFLLACTDTKSTMPSDGGVSSANTKEEKSYDVEIKKSTFEINIEEINVTGRVAQANSDKPDIIYGDFINTTDSEITIIMSAVRSLPEEHGYRDWDVAYCLGTICPPIKAEDVHGPVEVLVAAGDTIDVSIKIKSYNLPGDAEVIVTYFDKDVPDDVAEVTFKYKAE